LYAIVLLAQMQLASEWAELLTFREESHASQSNHWHAMPSIFNSDMSKPSFLFVTSLILVPWGLILPSRGQDAASQIHAEIGRLSQSLKDAPIADSEFASVAAMAADSLRAASESANASRLYLSLEQLGLGVDLFRGAQAGADKDEVVKGGLTAFESKWGKANLVLTELDQKAQSRDWKNPPAAIRALSETAQGRSLPLLAGGRGFATATAPKDGLLYIGQSQGEAEFARFCASLNLLNRNASLPLRSMLPELVAIQQKTKAAFQPPRSVELHPRFIALNSTLKLAQELDARKFYAGSLYQYLEAVRHYAMLDVPQIDPAREKALPDIIAAEQRKLAAATRDFSIAQLFVERAASQVTHANGSAPSPDEWRSAQVIVDQVLPAYFAAEKASPALASPSARSVTITLVRWPYT